MDVGRALLFLGKVHEDSNSIEGSNRGLMPISSLQIYKGYFPFQWISQAFSEKDLPAWGHPQALRPKPQG